MSKFTGRSNPRIKQIRSLYQRKQRQATGLFVVEGIRHVGEAEQAEADIEYLCYAPDLLSSAFAQDLLVQLERRGVPCLAVDADTFASLAEKENPQGLLAVVRQPRVSLEDLRPEIFPWGVALVAPQDPGNIGTILRTVDAVGASGLLLLEDSADPFHPGAVRASMGALFWYPVVQASFTAFATWAGQHGYHLYGTSSRGSVDYRTITTYTRPTILVLGSEREGLTPEQANACELLVRMPMSGRVTSLNLAVAAGVMLYDMLDKMG